MSDTFTTPPPPPRSALDPRHGYPPADHAAPAPAPVDPKAGQKAAEDKIWALAKKQSDERCAAAKAAKNEAKRSLKPGDSEKAVDDLMAAKTAASSLLREKQAKEVADAKIGTMPTFNGYHLQEAAAALHAELSAVAGEHHFEVGELQHFGLGFDVFDPMTGMVMSPARAHRRDIGDPGQLMTVAGVLSDIASARAHQRTAGVTQYSADNRVA